MNNLKVLIVEDEPLAASLIEEYLGKIGFLDFVKSFHDPQSALDFMQNHPIDVIFLDIHLPQMTGLDFITKLRSKTQIILTTAYHQYALESYDYHVVDYLLKPIEFDRFEKAVFKLRIARNQDFITINVNKTNIRIVFNDITHIESQRDYLLISTITKITYKTKMTLTNIVKILPANFKRIHRSFIVNKDHVNSYNASKVVIGDQLIPIGRKYSFHKNT